MTKKIGYISLLLVITLLLTACAAGGRTEITSATNEYETDYSTVETEIIALQGLKDKDFESKINADIEESIESAVVAFDTNAQNDTAALKGGNKCVFETVWHSKYNEKDFVSQVEERYTYMGGAHGETAWLSRNIDIAASKEVRLADLFQDNSYITALNRLIDEEIADSGGKYADLWEKPEIKESNQTDFYIHDDDLVIYYQPYDLSYYARGFVEFEIDLEDLSGYLKEEYRRLID